MVSMKSIGLMQGCGNSSAEALELPQSYIKSSDVEQDCGNSSAFALE